MSAGAGSPAYSFRRFPSCARLLQNRRGSLTEPLASYSSRSVSRRRPGAGVVRFPAFSIGADGPCFASARRLFRMTRSPRFLLRRTAHRAATRITPPRQRPCGPQSRSTPSTRTAPGCRQIALAARQNHRLRILNRRGRALLRFSSGDSATTSSRRVSAMNIYLLFLVSLELRDYNGNVLSEHKRRKIIF